jgi:hypothetical protein
VQSRRNVESRHDQVELAGREYTDPAEAHANGIQVCPLNCGNDLGVPGSQFAGLELAKLLASEEECHVKFLRVHPVERVALPFEVARHGVLQLHQPHPRRIVEAHSEIRVLVRHCAKQVQSQCAPLAEPSSITRDCEELVIRGPSTSRYEDWWVRSVGGAPAG